MRILAQLAPSPLVSVVHEHPLSRFLIPIAHVQPSVAELCAGRLVPPLPSNLSGQEVRVDPLLSYCAPELLASLSDRLLLLTRNPVTWVESMARKIRIQKLFPLIRALPILRPPAPAVLCRNLSMLFPAESPYLVGLLAAYVHLHRRMLALPGSPPVLHYEDLYAHPDAPGWFPAWSLLFNSLGWTSPFPHEHLRILLQQPMNTAPAVHYPRIREHELVLSVVMSLIDNPDNLC
ncbi:MAG: hypothetical protein WCF98_09485 [Synechococcus sp. ELA057]